MGAPTDNIRSKMSELADRFHESLPTRFAEIRKALNQVHDRNTGSITLEHVRLLVHRLSGTAGSFGADELSNEAKETENLLGPFIDKNASPSMQEWKSIYAALDRMEAASLHVDLQGASWLEDGKTERIPRQNGSENGQGESSKNIIYFIEKDSEIAEDVKKQLEYFGYLIHVKRDIHEVRTILSEEGNQVIIINTSMINSVPGIRNELNAIKQEYYGRVHIIFVSEENDFPTRLNAVRYGGEGFFLLPLDTGRLIDRIDTLLERTIRAPFHVLIVDDDQEQVSQYAFLLQQAGMITSVASDPMRVINVLVEAKPELILMDLYMPECGGLELAAVIRQMDAFVGIPIVFISGEQDKGKQLEAIRLGGDDFIMKHVETEYLISTITYRAERTRGMRFFMERDSLTGLLNHTPLKEALAREMMRGERSGSCLCFAMIDADHFKHVNDTYGHLTGDRVLKSLARLLQERLRRTDIIGRYGGEEFAVVLLNTTMENAGRIIDTIRENFSRIKQRSETGEEFFVTFSCGISSFPGVRDPSELTAAADRALYEAKELGRNRVILMPEPLME